MIPLGEPLTERDYGSLATSWITPDLAIAAGLRRVDSLTGGAIAASRSHVAHFNNCVEA